MIKNKNKNKNNKKEKMIIKKRKCANGTRVPIPSYHPSNVGFSTDLCNIDHNYMYNNLELRLKTVHKNPGVSQPFVHVLYR